jgi:hypothetical protein
MLVNLTYPDQRMDAAFKILLALVFVALWAVISFGVAAGGTYLVCRTAWSITGDDGYLLGAWVFAFFAWPVVFLAGLLLTAQLLRRRERRQAQPRGFPVGTVRSKGEGQA